MSEFDGRKVLAGAVGIIVSALLIALVGPLGLPFFMIALIYTMIVSSAKEVSPTLNRQELQTVESASGWRGEGLSRSCEIVIQNASGERLGFRQQEVHWKYW